MQQGFYAQAVWLDRRQDTFERQHDEKLIVSVIVKGFESWPETECLHFVLINYSKNDEIRWMEKQK